MHKRPRTSPLGRLMAEREMTDNALAKALKALELGMGRKAPTQPTISRIATGRIESPAEETLEPIAQFFGVTTGYLRGKESRAAPPKAKASDASGLSARAIEVARAWMRLPDYKQKGYAQGIMVDAAVVEVFPELEKAMRAASMAADPAYHRMTEGFQRAREKLKHQLELDLKSDP